MIGWNTVCPEVPQILCFEDGCGNHAYHVGPISSLGVKVATSSSFDPIIQVFFFIPAMIIRFSLPCSVQEKELTLSSINWHFS